MEYIIIKSLQLFGEGGGEGGAAGGAAAGAASAGGAEGAAASSAAGAQATAKTGVKSNNPLAGVKYGVQEAEDAQGDAAPADATQPVRVAADERRQKFDELMHGEMKDLFDEWAQTTVQRRLKSTKETVDRYEALTPVLQMLGQKYGVDASDTQALVKAIEEDDAYYEDEALESVPAEEDLGDEYEIAGEPEAEAEAPVEE